MVTTRDHLSPPETRHRLALSVLAGALVLDLSGLAVLNAALPGIGGQFNLGNSTLQWTMTAYAVTFAGFLLFGGRAADVFGRRLVFTVGVALFSAAALAGAMAPSIAVLIFARAAQGVGAALSGPAALALLAEVFPEGQARNRALSVYAAAGGGGFSGGMLLGGLLMQQFGWRSVLVFSGVFGIVILLAIRAGLPAGARHRTSPDLPGAVAVTLGLLLAVFGVSRGGESGWSDPGTLWSLVIAAVLLVTFVLWERRTPKPLLPLAIFRSGSTQFATLTAFLHYTGSVGLLFFAPLYLQGMLGYSPLQSGLAVLPMSVAATVTANFLTGRLLVRVGTGAVLATALALIGMSMVTWMWTPLDGSLWLNVLPGLVISGVGQGLSFPAMTSVALSGVPQQQHAVAGAVNVVAQQIGGSIGVAALVVVAAASDGTAAGQLAGFHKAYLTAAFACIIGALAIVATARRWDDDSAPAVS